MTVQEIPRMQQDPGNESKDSLRKVSEKESPRCVLEIPITDGSLDSDRLSSPGSSSGRSSSSSTSASNPNTTEKETPKGSSSYGYAIPWKGFFSSGKTRSRGRRFSTTSIPLLSNCELTAKALRQKLARMWTAEVGADCLGFVRRPSWRNFSFAELEAATDKFSPENLVGKGGHAEVYKGSLPDGTLVAVKRLTVKDDHEEERTADFLTELGIIAHVDHSNIDKLIGFGIQNGLYLVLQYAINGSVESRLQGAVSLQFLFLPL